VSVRLLPTLVAETLAHAPDLAIEVVPGEVSSQLAGWLLEGRVDVTFLDQPVDDPHIAVDLVLRDPYVVVTRLDDPALRGLGRGAGYPVRALGEQPLVAPEPHHAHTVIESWLADHGVTPRYSFRTNDNGSLQAMVSAGLGPALMPLLAVDEADPAVRVLRTEPPLPPRDVLVARRTDTTALPAADVFARRAVIAGGARELRLASETRPRSRRRTADADG
jgi:DNA-binding transcriptional LysR family regulator